MSIPTEAQIQIILADYAAADVAGKLNVIGGGLNFIGSGGAGTPSTPFTAVVLCWVPGKYAGQTFAFTVELHDVTIGQIVQLPSPQVGQFQPVRAQQAVTITPVQVAPGLAVPQDSLQAHNMVIQFANGLPLEPGHSYEWRVQIDGQHRPNWWYRFHVLGAAPGPVFGGPAGPSTIPGVAPFPGTESTEVEGTSGP